MSSQHNDGDGFWGGERDWTDSHRRQSRDGRTSLGDRLRTGVNSVLDVGAAGGRQHGDSGRTPVVESSTKLDAVEPSLQPDATRQAAAGLSIGELAMPWESGVHEPTMPVERVNAAVAEPPPEFDAAPLEGDPQPAHDGADAAWGEEWAPETYAVPPPRGGIDPLLAKVGAVAVALTLLVPFVLSLRGESDDRLVGASEEAATLVDLDLGEDGESVSDGATAADDGAAGSGDQSSESGSAAGSGDQSSGSSATAPESTKSAAETGDEPPAAESCAADYDVVDGDYWLRLSEGAGVPLSELLDANAASANTPLYPGRTICLPTGSSTPPPPPAPSPAPPAASSSSASSSSGGSSASSASSSSSSSSGSSSRSVAATPATTQPPPPPSTQPPPPPPPPAPAVVEQIIRDVWPDELEDKALAIAWRESNYKTTAKNYCCYGLFQMYWSVHKSWLSGIGITSANQLYDAESNARAAYTLYQRAGGWGPWGG